jgi:SAM-dependent methyltransferase
VTWAQLLARTRRPVRLYAGDIPPWHRGVVGLSLHRSDRRHIQHDIATAAMPLPDDFANSYQAEDVFEHIAYESLPAVIDEIHRVLQPGGLFRLSVPDYRCDVLIARSRHDAKGRIVFDPGGGGAYVRGRVVGGGHVWFPRYESVRALVQRTRFATAGKIAFLHYYDEHGTPVTNPIDYSHGFVGRTPDNDDRVRSPYRPMSIVVDLTKV